MSVSVFLYVVLFLGLLAWFFRNRFSRSLDGEMRQMLFKYLRYYRHLTDKQRKVFDHRVATFLRGKKFVARHGMELTPEVEALIAATAVKISFGLGAYRLPHFHTILVYPEEYFSTIRQQHHKGEVNAGGIIVLSWKAFAEGHADPDDGLNLGIHEFAHALFFENLKANGEQYFIEPEVLQHWFDVAFRQVGQLAKMVTPTMREYAYSSKEEFWAVSTEVFFEQPQRMQVELPEYYECMKQVYRQDPVAIYSLPPTPLV